MRCPIDSAGRAAEDGEEVAEDVAFVAGEGEVDEAEVELHPALAAARIVLQQTCAMVGRQVALRRVELRRVEEVVEVVQRHV